MSRQRRKTAVTEYRVMIRFIYEFTLVTLSVFMATGILAIALKALIFLA
jgi:hypothetical protein